MAPVSRRRTTMEIKNLVVARFRDGQLAKGTTNDFFPQRRSFHVAAIGGGEVREIETAKLKAVFFVHGLEGDPERQDLRGFVAAPGETARGRKIAVRFEDGEVLCGYAQTFSKDRDGFFLFPADPGSNNQRVYVLAAATSEIALGDQAEAMAAAAVATVATPAGDDAPPAPEQG